MDIVRTLLPTYGKRVVFTHQEIWQDFATKKVFSTIEEWRLESEPWIFIVDRQGMIRARFEGLVTARELETALQDVLLPETEPHRRGIDRCLCRLFIRPLQRREGLPEAKRILFSLWSCEPQDGYLFREIWRGRIDT